MKLFSVALIVALFGAVTFSHQDSGELSPAAQERLKQAGASIVIVKASNESGETTAEGRGFFIRKDLIATDSEVVDRNTHHVSVTTRAGAVKVISSGNYFLPYVLLETQPDVSPLPLPDSDRIAANENVYMLSDAGEILTGKITGATKIKNTPAFLVSFAISSTNRGAPIFNRYAEVIGIAAKSPDGQSAGIAWPADQLATLRHLGEPGVGVGAGMGPGFSDNAAPTYKPSPAETVDSKPVRLSSPRPQYTEEARANSIQGTVLLRVQVDIDGSVRGVRVVRGLPYGLSEQAIAVARQTKFKPAMKDGKPVAYWVGMEINFNLY